MFLKLIKTYIFLRKTPTLIKKTRENVIFHCALKLTNKIKIHAKTVILCNYQYATTYLDYKKFTF